MGLISCGIFCSFAVPMVPTSSPSLQVPVVEDIDKYQLEDPYANAVYAKEIFDYMRGREVSDLQDGGEENVLSAVLPGWAGPDLP